MIETHKEVKNKEKQLINKTRWIKSGNFLKENIHIKIEY